MLTQNSRMPQKNQKDIEFPSWIMISLSSEWGVDSFPFAQMLLHTQEFNETWNLYWQIETLSLHK